jgi:hypothetical protein
MFLRPAVRDLAVFEEIIFAEECNRVLSTARTMQQVKVVAAGCK